MIGRPLYRLEAVTSTQDIVFRLAERGAPEGTAVIAGFQSSGSGRSGRAWTTHPGEALLASILLRPTISPERFALFSLLIGDAIATVLEHEFNLRPAVKWPNDVLLDGRKVSGVLISTRTLSAGGPRVAVAGIGINITSSRENLPQGATSVGAESGTQVDVEMVRRSLFDEIDRRYRALEVDSIDRYVARLNERLWLRGESVSIDDLERRITGRLLGVERDGALVLETPQGRRRIHSGEMTRGPRMIGK